MATVADPIMLSKVPLFGGLSIEQLSNLSAVLHRKTFAAGANLMTAGQPGEVVYIILDGAVKVHAEQVDGNDIIIAILGAGDIVGEMSVLDSTCRCASVVTIEESTLLWIDHAGFHRCLRAMPAIACNLARILASRLRLANEQIQALGAMEVESRVARQLLAFVRHYGEPSMNGDVLIPIRLTQSDIAGLVGASRVRVNQVMVSYKERRYISVGPNHRITVHNPKALASRCR